MVEKTVEGLDGHGTSLEEGCEGSPGPSKVSSPGKLSVFSKSAIGSLAISSVMVLEMRTNAIVILIFDKYNVIRELSLF